MTIVGTIELAGGETLSVTDAIAVRSSAGRARSRELTGRLRADPPRTWEGDPGLAALRRVASWFPFAVARRDPAYRPPPIDPAAIY